MKKFKKIGDGVNITKKLETLLHQNNLYFDVGDTELLLLSRKAGERAYLLYAINHWLEYDPDHDKWPMVESSIIIVDNNDNLKKIISLNDEVRGYDLWRYDDKFIMSGWRNLIILDEDFNIVRKIKNEKNLTIYTAEFIGGKIFFGREDGSILELDPVSYSTREYYGHDGRIYRFFHVGGGEYLLSGYYDRFSLFNPRTGEIKKVSIPEGISCLFMEGDGVMTICQKKVKWHFNRETLSIEVLK